jgi:hypothetical protein
VEHAHAVARLLRQRHGVRAVVVTSDDPDASERIAAFASSRDPWIVAVRMVSEGVDIPRLRVGVYATTTVTELFFRQAVGRLVRWQAGHRRQKAFMFLPTTPAEDSPRSWPRRGPTPSGDASRTGTSPAWSSTSSSSPAARTSCRCSRPSPPPRWGDPTGGVFDDAHPEDLIVEDEAGADHGDRAGCTSAAGRCRGAGTHPDRARTQRKRELRQENTDRVRMLTHLTGLTPEVVNARLNQEVGISSINEASLAQLERRRRLADRWIDRA